MGRRPEFDVKVMVRVAAALPARIKAVLRPKENMAGFFRATATREVERRERGERGHTEPGNVSC